MPEVFTPPCLYGIRDVELEDCTPDPPSPSG